MTRYEFYKQQRRCTRCGDRLPRHVTTWKCAACCARQRDYNRDHALRYQDPVPGPNLVAHCGSWHLLQTVPWPCPVCGAVLLQEEP